MSRINTQPQPHKQVIAKVNSYVDEKIKELVELLNTFDNVWIFESCQGENEESAFNAISYGMDKDATFKKYRSFTE